MRSNNQSIGTIMTVAVAVVAAGFWSVAGFCPTATAQTPTFQPLMTGTDVGEAQYVAGRVYAGLPKGGVVVWDAGTSQVLATLTRRDGLGGHFVKDMAWTGERLWIATGDGGLTSMEDPGGPGEFMSVHSSLLSSLDVTAVTGQVVGTTERVYYGTGGAGIGEIVGGLPGAYFSTQNGLINDTVDAMSLSGDLLLIATPTGVSRFAANTFTSYPYGNPLDEDEWFTSMVTAADGQIYAGNGYGAHRWNDTDRLWETVFSTDSVLDLAATDDAVYALTWSFIWRIDDGSATRIDVPSAPAGYNRFVSSMTAGDGETYVGGFMRPVGQSPFTSSAVPWVAPGGNSAAVVRAIGSLTVGATGGVDGAAIDSRGRPWLGDRWGDGLGSFDGSVWYNVTETATVENDSNGFLDYGGAVLDMARDGDALWLHQYVAGVIRFVPAAAPGGDEDWLLLTPNNSPLVGDSHAAITVHPDGVVLFGTTDANFGGINNSLLGVDVLFDQTRPRDPNSWLHIYPSTLGGNIVGAIGVEQRDVIWFAVRNSGLVRWDVNGLGAGPDDPLTWRNTADDHWAGPFETVPGSNLALDQGNAIQVAADGSLYVGGTGLVQFTYQPVFDLMTLVNEWTQKESAVETGLLGQVVSGLAFDHNAALWVLSEGGLNRMRFLEDRTVFDAFTDLATYLTFDPSFYAPSAISALPGGTYSKLGVSADGRSLVISSDLGGAGVTIPRVEEETAGGDVSKAYLFPNPFPGEGVSTALSVGGIDISDEAPVSLEILNLVGQVVYRSRDLSSGEQIWDGLNRQGSRVASGMYVVKLNHGGQTTVRTLAVTY